MAFTALATVSAVGLTLSSNTTPYAAEVPSVPGVSSSASGSPAPTSVSPSAPPTRTAPATRTQTKAPTGNTQTTRAPVTGVPPEAMLSASDLGPGVTGDEQRTDDHGSLSMTLSQCARRPTSWQQRVDTLGFRQRWLRYPNGMFAVQEVSRQPAPVARNLVADARAAFGGPCASVPIGGDPNTVAAFTILPGGWGDESLLMRESRPVEEVEENGTPGAARAAIHTVAWRILIRQGDLITEIRTSVEGMTEAQARELARRAAQRMCVATPTC